MHARHRIAVGSQRKNATGNFECGSVCEDIAGPKRQRADLNVGESGVGVHARERDGARRGLVGSGSAAENGGNAASLQVESGGAGQDSGAAGDTATGELHARHRIAVGKQRKNAAGDFEGRGVCKRIGGMPQNQRASLNVGEAGVKIRGRERQRGGGTVLDDTRHVRADDGTDRDTTAAAAGVGHGASVVQAAGADGDAGGVGGVVVENEIGSGSTGDASAEGEDTASRCLERVVSIEDKRRADADILIFGG